MNTQISLQDKALNLFECQVRDWALAAHNFDALQRVEIKSFLFDGFSIKVQFNPARAISSLAKVDSKTIADRPCFLCEKNRPKEQASILFKGRYDILVNPYPIFQKHFTIVSRKHENQYLTLAKIDDMLDIALQMPDFLIFYNGAKAGASAPDHFHFQAGNADFFTQSVFLEMKGLLRKEIKQSDDRQEIKDWLRLVINDGNEISDKSVEPMMNIFCQYQDGKWCIVLFPRKVHRPAQYHNGYLMISPGAVDMAGVLIVARREDFDKITKKDIQDIYAQVSLM